MLLNPWREVSLPWFEGISELGWTTHGRPLLLVVMVERLAVVDPSSSRVLAELYDEQFYNYLDGLEDELRAPGPGDFQRHVFQFTGMRGGAFSTETLDGWRLRGVDEDGGTVVLLEGPGLSSKRPLREEYPSGKSVAVELLRCTSERPIWGFDCSGAFLVVSDFRMMRLLCRPACDPRGLPRGEPSATPA